MTEYDPFNPPGILLHEVPEGTLVATSPHSKPFVEVREWTTAENGNMVRVNVRYLIDDRIESWPAMLYVWGPEN